MVKIPDFGARGLGPKSWLCHTGYVASEPEFIHMKNNHNNTNLTKLLGGLELISYLKCLKQSVCACSVSKLCPTLCNSMDCSPPGLSDHGFPRQEYWHMLPFPPPGDLPYPGIEPTSPALAGGFFTTEPPGNTVDTQIASRSYNEDFFDIFACRYK